jgi:hypothetical protein
MVGDWFQAHSEIKTAGWFSFMWARLRPPGHEEKKRSRRKVRPTPANREEQAALKKMSALFPISDLAL